MADVRWIFQKEAIKFLAEGDPRKVIDILKDGVELTDEFRNDLAAFIEGSHPSKVRLKVSHPKGPHRKQLANFPRDYAAHQTICEYREETGKSAADAIVVLAKDLGMSESALEKLHDAFNKADAVMRDIDRELAGQK